MNEYKQIRYWVEDLPKMGKTSFALSEVKALFPQKPSEQIKNALNRLVSSGKIASVWRGFYVIVSPDYGLKGSVPPTEYIDHLMGFLEKDYYVSTLSAAALHGAAHQRPHVFTFVCDQILHPKEKSGIHLIPLIKKRIPHKYIERKNVKSGGINVSTPELTAVDLLLYPLKSGGLGNIITILADLSESIDMTCLDKDFFDNVPASIIQRLGYLLDVGLGNAVLANELLDKSKFSDVKFRKTPLASYRNTNEANSPYNNKWKVIVNDEIEADI